MADKEVRIRVKADIEPQVVQPRVTIQPNQIDDGRRFVIPQGSGQGGGYGVPKTPMPPPRNFEEERYNRIRRSADENLRSFISESSKYTTSSREMERYIGERVKRIGSASELDYSRQVSVIGERVKAGTISNREATEQLRLAKEQYNEDKLQTKILRDTLETIKATSRDEIRENSKAVQEKLSTSRNVGRLGIVGDEYKAFSEKFQADELQTEKVLQKFNLGRYTSVASQGMNLGGAFATGNVGGIARSMMSFLTSPQGLATLAVIAPIAAIGGSMAAGVSSTEKMRSYMIATQTPASLALFKRGSMGEIFPKIGLETEEGMNLYANILRSSGGANLSNNSLLALTSLTRARDVSPELLGQTIGFNRYSNGGSALGVVSAFEQALSKKFGSGDEFKRKLVQLPEMMGVYNTLAQQMLQNTGRFNSNNLSNFVSGVGTAFGVEGVNLQRYATGITGMFSRSDNPFISKFQYAALRDINPDITRQQALEILEKPTDNPDYMRAMYRRMRGTNDMNIFRSWTQQMGGFGAAESRQMYESKSFEEFFSLIKQKQGNKTIPDDKEMMNKYFEDAKSFQNSVKTFIDSFKDLFTTGGIRVAADIEYFTSGQFKKDFGDLSVTDRLLIGSTFLRRP